MSDSTLFQNVQMAVAAFGKTSAAAFSLVENALVVDPSFSNRSTKDRIVVSTRTRGGSSEALVTSTKPGELMVVAEGRTLEEWLSSCIPLSGFSHLTSGDIFRWWRSNGKHFPLFGDRMPAEIRGVLYEHIFGPTLSPWRIQSSNPIRDRYLFPEGLEKFQHKGMLALDKRSRMEIMDFIHLNVSLRCGNKFVLRSLAKGASLSLKQAGRVTIAFHWGSNYEDLTTEEDWVDHHCTPGCMCIWRDKEDSEEIWACIGKRGRQFRELRLVAPRIEMEVAERTEEALSLGVDKPTLLHSGLRYVKRCSKLTGVFMEYMEKMPAQSYIIEGWKHRESRELLMALVESAGINAKIL